MTDLATWLIVAAAIAFSLFMVVRHNRLRSKNDDLLTSGVSAQANVLRLRPEGTEDDLFIVALELVRPASAPQPIEVQWFIPAHALPSVQPGKTVAVRYDATNSSRVILDLRAMGLG